MEALKELVRACFEQHTNQGARNFQNLIDEVQRERDAVAPGAGVLVLNSWFYGVRPAEATDGSLAHTEDQVRAAARDYVAAVFEAVMPAARVLVFIRPGNLIIEITPKSHLG